MMKSAVCGGRYLRKGWMPGGPRPCEALAKRGLGLRQPGAARGGMRPATRTEKKTDEHLLHSLLESGS